MPTRRVLKEGDLIDNPAPRIPIALVLDASPSMSGRVDLGAAVEQHDPSPIDELNRGVAQLLDQIRGDDLSSAIAEIAILSFSSEVQLICDFGPVEKAPTPSIALHSEGRTERDDGSDIGGAVLRALVLVENRKEAYKHAGVDFYQPRLVLMTDGRPTTHSHLEAGAMTRGMASRGKLTVLAVGIGRGADMSVLQMFDGTGGSEA